MSDTKLYTSQPRTLDRAVSFRNTLLNAQVHGVPLRFKPVIIHAETEGYHVCDLGFATSNGFEIVR